MGMVRFERIQAVLEGKCLATALLLMGVLVVATGDSCAQTRFAPTWDSLDQRQTPDWFTDAKFGIFIHWGPYAVPAYAPVGAYAEWYWRHLERGPVHQGSPNPTYLFHERNYGKNFTYADFAPQFRAELFEPDRWADLFRRSGARYVVLTSKHHDGFALWPSRHANASWGRPWNAVAIGAKRDLLGDLSESVREAGLRMGVYYSLYEWYNPVWMEDRARFVTQHMHPQFKDLVTRYRPEIIFSDGEWDMPSEDWKSPELLAWLFNDSPVAKDVVVNDRWGKETRHHHGSYYTTEYAAGMDSDSHPWEENRGMGFSYGYNRAENLEDYRSGREFVLMLIDLVSRGGNLLLNVGPTADGRIPVIQQQRLLEIGDWLQLNGEAIYGTRAHQLTRQWSAGTVPVMETGEYKVKYDVLDFVDRPQPGQAVIEAFFTRKGVDLYAILPRWKSGEFVLKGMNLPGATKATMLASGLPIRWQAKGRDTILRLPENPAATEAPSAAGHAWVVKLEGALPSAR